MTLGKCSEVPIGETNSGKSYGVGNRIEEVNLLSKFQTQRSINFEDTAKTISGIYAEEIGKLGLPISRASLHCFQKRITLESSP